MMVALLALLPMTILTKYLFFRRPTHTDEKKARSIDAAYFAGLNYLIDNQPDKAIDAFTHLLEVDQDTIELHLSLGCLFRTRGEVSRAIRIHENILARPLLSDESYAHVQYELARDYLQAGFLNYAESHFSKLIKGRSDFVEPSLLALVGIYEQEKDWLNAIKIAKRIMQSFKPDIASQLAHYYCEHVLSIPDAKIKTRQQFLQSALKTSPGCVRATLMNAELFLEAKKPELAVQCLKHVKDQDISFIRETTAPMQRAVAMGANSTDVESFWRSCLEEIHDSEIMIALAKTIQSAQGDHLAIEFLSMMMRSTPSIPVMLLLVEIYIEHSEGNAKEKLRLLRGFMLETLRRELPYLCQKCGFSGALIYWQCPGCRSWDTVKPKDQCSIGQYMEY